MQAGRDVLIELSLATKLGGRYRVVAPAGGRPPRGIRHPRRAGIYPGRAPASHTTSELGFSAALIVLGLRETRLERSQVPCNLLSMERYEVRLNEGGFHVEGFPDAVKLISISDIAPKHSRELADIASCRLDLVFAKACLDFLGTADNPSPVLRDALWRAAIIYYCKCFAQSGPRRPLPYTKILPIIPNLEAQPREIHKYFRGLRNKHIAHDENAWLQVLAGAVIASSGKAYNIEKVTCATFQGQTLDDGNFGNLYLLIERALTWAESRFDALCDEVTEELEKLPRETLLDQPDLKYRAPEAKDVNSPRSRG